MMTLAYLRLLIHLAIYLKRFSESSLDFASGIWIQVPLASSEHPSQSLHKHRVTRQEKVWGSFWGHGTLFLESIFSKVAVCLESVSWCCSYFLTFLREQPQWPRPPPPKSIPVLDGEFSGSDIASP